MFKKNTVTDVDNDANILDKTTHLKNECLISPNEYILSFDGCSKGNPGQAGCGAVICKNGQEVWSGSKYLGKKTNNQAEYSGLVFGLTACIRMGIKVLKVQGDSLVIISQMNKKYLVNSPLLIPLYHTACGLSSNFVDIEFSHVYRKDNKRADELANQSLIDKETQTENVGLPDITMVSKPKPVQTSISSAISKMFKKPINP